MGNIADIIEHIRNKDTIKAQKELDTLLTTRDKLLESGIDVGEMPQTKAKILQLLEQVIPGSTALSAQTGYKSEQTKSGNLVGKPESASLDLPRSELYKAKLAESQATTAGTQATTQSTLAGIPLTQAQTAQSQAVTKKVASETLSPEQQRGEQLTKFIQSTPHLLGLPSYGKAMGEVAQKGSPSFETSNQLGVEGAAIVGKDAKFQQQINQMKLESIGDSIKLAEANLKVTMAQLDAKAAADKVPNPMDKVRDDIKIMIAGANKDPDVLARAQKMLSLVMQPDMIKAGMPPELVQKAFDLTDPKIANWWDDYLTTIGGGAVVGGVAAKIIKKGWKSGAGIGAGIGGLATYLLGKEPAGQAPAAEPGTSPDNEVDKLLNDALGTTPQPKKKTPGATGQY